MILHLTIIRLVTLQLLFIALLYIILTLPFPNYPVLEKRFSQTLNNDLLAFNASQPICRINFILAGPKADYNMSYFHSWLDLTKPYRCQIDFIKDNHYMMTSMITSAEKETAEWMSVVPVIKADYMKFLALYYLAGIATDFDVQARKVYPEEWYTVKDHTHDCSLLLGLEHDCWDDVCKKKYSFAADGQINTWLLASKVPHSPFLRLYLDRIGKQPHKPLGVIPGSEVVIFSRILQISMAWKGCRM